jgi:predicted ATPase
MELQLKNIGMIKEASVKIDGLTVITGENDTGKSTLGKSLYLQLKSIQNALDEEGSFFDSNDFIDYLFNKNMTEKGKITLILQQNIYWSLEFLNSKLDGIGRTGEGTDDVDHFLDAKDKLLNPLIIETPLVWNFTDFFRDIAQIESQMNIKLDYPYLMKDLNFKLHIKSASNGLDIKEKVTSLMGGEFKKDEMGRYYFDKRGQRIELVNTATGIKYFGIFQVLSQNNYLNENTVLVLDEPEVHLHPKWQLEMAKIIVELVKNGVKIVVNSHSPYMIEALQRYSELSKINSDFYIAEDGYIKKVNDSNAETLSKIFEKLSEPFDVFDEMDSQSMEKLING